MKTLHKIFLAIAILSVTMLQAQDKKEMSKEEKAWMEYMTPSKAHTDLALTQGIWEEEMTMWMAPGAPETKSTATVANKMIMGGRYLQGTHKGKIDGMQFEGMSITGYDNALKKYFSSWIDNMGTGVMNMTGNWNEELKAMELSGTSVDPISGKQLPVREVLTIKDNDTHVLDMFMTTADGKEYQNMHIVMKRKKIAPTTGVYKDTSGRRKTEPGAVQPIPPAKK